jgi:hypothetical protein
MSGDGTQIDDTTLITSFEQCTISTAEWNHRAHIRVGFLYARQDSLDDAISRMRAGLQALNEAHRVPEAAGRGYHETKTVAFMRLIHAACKYQAFVSSEEFCKRNSELTAKDVLFHYYSRERLASLQAKITFLEPDLAPLPT